MIESISIIPELTLEQQKYLSYSVTYLDDVPLEVKDILHANKARTLKVRVEYKKNIENNELLSSDETINIKVTIKYSQADNTAKESLSEEGEIFRIISLISGDGTNVGDELAIRDEHFYVVSNDGNEIVLLSKYNLLVGNSYDGSILSSLTNSTGIQDESAIAWHYRTGTSTLEYPFIGTVPFSSSAYWSSGEYIYNGNVSIKTYVDNYKDYLESLGAEIIEARLITYDELIQLGCRNMCSTAPSWVYSTTYWSGTGAANSSVYAVLSNAVFSNSNRYNNNKEIGVRPVIVIPADSI